MQYDAVIIGAGMSGMCAAIRLAMFDKKVCLVERHSIAGGLNSYYKRAGRELDVGLHALTNFANKGERGLPLTKLLKQLRIPWASLELAEQSFSKVTFNNKEIKFSNDFSLLKSEIEEKFPDQFQSFCELVDLIMNFNETNLDSTYESAKAVIKKYLSNEKLVEMLICPLLIYGSSWEMDMDFSQFVIMFKAIYLEGFSRPKGGVRTIINLLLKKYKDLGGEVRFRSEVKKISPKGSYHLLELKKGEVLETKKIISSMGLPETLSIVEGNTINEEVKKRLTGKMTFTESILFFDKKPKEYGINETIHFYNENEVYEYRKPEISFDSKSAVICLPNNFESDDYEEGVVRITFMANYEKWINFSKEEYKEEKQKILNESLELIKKAYPDFQGELNYSDIFTPKTIEKYTSHYGGCVYGSEIKLRDGRTKIPGLYICGTDQGFLGIVGASLSGISMSNLHILSENPKSDGVHLEV